MHTHTNKLFPINLLLGFVILVSLHLMWVICVWVDIYCFSAEFQRIFSYHCTLICQLNLSATNYFWPTCEFENFFIFLILQEEMQIEAVSVGAIFSDYQRVRVENVWVNILLFQLYIILSQSCLSLSLPSYFDFIIIFFFFCILHFAVVVCLWKISCYSWVLYNDDL